jgi:hypothetical protein
VPTNSSALLPSAQDLRTELDGFIPNMTKGTGCLKAGPVWHPVCDWWLNAFGKASVPDHCESSGFFDIVLDDVFPGMVLSAKRYREKHKK